MNIPFQVTDWTKQAITRHPGESGEALWRTLAYDNLRIRLVDILPTTKQIIGVVKVILFIAWKGK